MKKTTEINMEKRIEKEYIAPEVKFVEVIVEEGFLISGIIINERFLQSLSRFEYRCFESLLL